MDSELLTTKEVCEVLGVSRSWVNNHLRHLGEPGWETNDRRWIFYDRRKILNYINTNATITRQTEFLDLAHFVPTDELLQKLKFFDSMPDPEEGAAAKAVYIRTILPDAYSPIYDTEFAARHRGEYPWYRDAKTKIDDLAHLATMADLRQHHGHSSEMIYRSNFYMGVPKITLHGRVWFFFEQKIFAGQRYLLVGKKG